MKAASQMREKRLFWNTITSILSQIVTVICAFILPRLILTTYGSDTNGLVQSIQQFLSIIAFLDMGVGAVVQSSLYKPLAQKDEETISKIMVSTNKFFRKLATVIGIYILVLSIGYQYISHSPFSIQYTASLVLALGLSYFAQYYFGLKNQLLLVADQKSYICNILSIVVQLLNNIVGCILILSGYSIQIVKISSAIILLVRPVFMELYVRHHYNIDWQITYTVEPVNQKWNGIAQHIATVVLISTDNIVLTLFSTLKNVSIYSVYHLVINGMNNLVLSFSQGTSAYFGNLIANQEKNKLNSSFAVFESVYHCIITVLYSCTAVLIMPFISIYTKGVNDTEYIVPLFAYLICAANLFYCIRMPYNSLVLSAGHFKQTQTSAITEAVINILVSVTTVIRFGLIGVSVGTLAAMFYRSIYLAWYSTKNILFSNKKDWMLHFFLDVLCSILVVGICSRFQMYSLEYISWLLLALKVVLVSLAVTISLNVIFFRNTLNIKDAIKLNKR